MNRTEFNEAFGDQIRRDLQDIQDLKDSKSEAIEKGRMDSAARLQKDIRSIHESIVACASAYLGIDDDSEAYKVALEIVTDGESKVEDIKEIRNRTGLSQARFAARYGIPRRTVENWEMRKTKAPDYLLKLLARVVWEDFPYKIK